ncbi:MAG TPA: vWA domain-containing protein, partial [Thermoanaerobaculia bacterium]|nr:vWA domain-containing protein [Thermoanaerobaculia bacterium]
RFSSLFRFGSDRVGLWRTTNGGTNWTPIGGGVAGLNIVGVAPRGATIVVAANTADSAINRGIWRSTNTGGLFTKISGTAGTGLPAGTSFDLAGDPSNNAVLYTNGGTTGIHRSADTGATWTKVSTAAMDALIAAASNVEISVGATGNVYVAIVGGGFLTGLFRSPDGQTGWTSLDLPRTTEADGSVFGIHVGGQGGVHLSIAADRTNANIVYLGGDRQPCRTELTSCSSPRFPNSLGATNFTGRIFRVDASQPAGSQATAITHMNTASMSAPHADSRDMAIDANNNLIETDDGGIYRRTNPLLNTGDWFALVGNLRVNELHSVEWDSNAKIAFGGAQDNGVPEQDLPGNVRWRTIANGDGGDVAVNSTAAASVRYSSTQSLGNFSRRTYSSANVFASQVFPALTVVGGGAAPAGFSFITPVAINRATPTRLLIAATNSLYESMDQGDTIREIPGLVVNSSPGDPLAYGAMDNAEVIYAGTGDRVFVRTAAAPAAPANSVAYPGNGTGRTVVDLVVNPANSQNAFVADATNVYVTSNAGGAWTNVTGNLLALNPGNIRSITFSTSNAAGRVIVGTDRGVFSATGPAFNVWSVLGSGLPRVPVFDLAYDAGDDLVVASSLGRGAWTLSVDERTPVDVGLVLDLSGSMLQPACPTCASRLQVLKDAVELFVQLFTVFAAPEDRMAVNYFRTNVNEFTPAGALFPFLANAPAVITDVQSQTTVGANLTAMGGGLQTAINRLNDGTRPRHVILFTDGMQNVNPMVNTTTFAIENQPGAPASGVSPTTPATTLSAALGQKVNTIGVGATPPFVELLDDIATQTNGLFKLTTAPDAELRRFYVENLIDALRNNSPQLVGYRHGAVSGQEAIEDFVSNGSAKRVALKLSWTRGTKLTFTVEKDGVPVRRAGRFINGDFYRIFTIDLPTTSLDGPIDAAGTWRLRITGPAGAAYEAAAIVDEEQLKYEFAIDGHDHVTGTPLPLRVKLTLAGQPVTDANVTARIRTPQIGLGTLLSKTPTPPDMHGPNLEPNASDAQKKYQLLLNDPTFVAKLQPVEHTITLTHTGGGNYIASYNGTALTGVYSANFHVAGTHAVIGTYERSEERTVSVRFGTALLNVSDLRIVQLGRVPGGQRFELRVTPIDGASNYLGPDSANRLALLLNGVRINTTPRDLLDGTYVFTFDAPEPAETQIVQVTVKDQPLYDGPLGDIRPFAPSPSGSGGRLWGSFHLGATIPSSGFPRNAENGFLAETDVEYRFTPTFSVESVLGLYDFGDYGSITGLTGYAKLYGTATPSWRWYAAAGPGAFKTPSGGSHGGGSFAVGLNRAINARTDFDTGAVYTHVFGEDVSWLALRVGVKLSF